MSDRVAGAMSRRGTGNDRMIDRVAGAISRRRMCDRVAGAMNRCGTGNDWQDQVPSIDSIKLNAVRHVILVA
jgi:hypothetical protein